LKRKPIIEKITFTDQETEEIKGILEGRPSKDDIEQQKARGMRIAQGANT
jgi:hypothetical protein